MYSHFIKLTSVASAAALLCSCASTTLIKSTPLGADLFIEGERVGKTPYSYTDTRIVGSIIHTKMRKSGYEDLEVTFTRSEEPDVGAIIGGVIALAPFLWCMKYKPERNYEMVPLAPEQSPVSSESVPFSYEQATPQPITKKSKKKKH